MRLSIDHRTTYRFSQPQTRLVQMLRLTPEDTHDQTIAAWRIDVDCDARLRTTRDGFGNKVTMIYAEGPLTHIEIAVTGEVLTSETPAAVLRGALDPLPPMVFLRSTPLTEPDEAIASFAAKVAGDGDSAARLQRLNAALHERFHLNIRRPNRGRTAAEAFVLPEATARDLAQMMIAAAHSLGFPARYVSGYCLTALSGAGCPTPHGWAEVHIEGTGWVAMDPCFGLRTDESYVRVAVGLDGVGAAPVAGSRLGSGDEDLDVDVHVDKVLDR